MTDSKKPNRSDKQNRKKKPLSSGWNDFSGPPATIEKLETFILFNRNEEKDKDKDKDKDKGGHHEEA